jgi:hypothetical protein
MIIRVVRLTVGDLQRRLVLNACLYLYTSIMHMDRVPFGCTIMFSYDIVSQSAQEQVVEGLDLSTLIV